MAPSRARPMWLDVGRSPDGEAAREARRLPGAEAERRSALWGGVEGGSAFSCRRGVRRGGAEGVGE